MLAIIAAIVTAYALFPDYYAGEESLASDVSNLVYNVGSIAAWGIAGVLLCLKRNQRTAAALLVGLTVAWAPTYLTSIGRVLEGDRDGGLGFLAGLVGLGFAIAACVAIIVGTPLAVLRWRTPHPGTIALALAASAALGFGLSGDWIETSIVTGAPEMEWIETGTDTLTETCCSWADTSGESALRQAGFILMPASIGLVAVAAIFFASSRVRGGLLTGATVVAASHVFSGAAWLFPPLDLVDDLGFTTQDVVTDQLSLGQSAMPAYWWTAVGMIGLAVLLMVSAVPRPDERARPTPQAPTTPAPAENPPRHQVPARTTVTTSPQPSKTSAEPSTTSAEWSGIALGVIATVILGPVALYAGVVAALALAQNFIAGWLPSSWVSGNAADWLFAGGTEGGAGNYVTFMIAAMIAAGCVSAIKAAFDYER